MILAIELVGWIVLGLFIGISIAIVDLRNVLQTQVAYYVGLNLIITAVSVAAWIATSNIFLLIGLFFLQQVVWNFVYFLVFKLSGYHFGSTVNLGMNEIVSKDVYYLGMIIQFIFAMIAFYFAFY